MYPIDSQHTTKTDKIVLPDGWKDNSRPGIDRFVVETVDERFSLAVVDEWGTKVDVEVMDREITDGDPIIEKKFVPIEEVNTHICELLVKYG